MAWSNRIQEARSVGQRIEVEGHRRGVETVYRLVSTSPESLSAHILMVADEVGAGLIVIGIRKRSPVGKLIFGNVARDLLLQTDCPVLAVKTLVR